MLVIFNPSICRSESAPIFGAIRWDAWTGGFVTRQVEKTLGPKKYHHRLPWFAKVINDKTVTIDGSAQAVMDQEISFASNAGLNYWAFLIYAKDDPMSVGLKQYLKSEKRTSLNFCMILHNSLKASEKNWPKERNHAISLLKESGYQTVLNQRPLIYVLPPNEVPHERVVELKKLVKKNGINPYFVYMGWNPAKEYQAIQKHKEPVFEAVSAYAYGSKQKRFLQLAKEVETNYWLNASRGKAPYIPLVTTGWDKRPRQDHHVSWEEGQAYHQQKTFPSMAKPKQIADHLQRAIDFTQSHADICSTKHILIYAWNEYDEGGWIAPTRGATGEPNASRLNAIKAVLKP